MKSYYHFCNEGLKNEVLFLNPAEFISGMNRVALSLLSCLNEGRDIQVICFCLMDNHVHFILFGEKVDCMVFCDKYRFLTSIWIGRHREERLREPMKFDGWPIFSRDKLKEKIAYVLRNPVAAGLNVTPWGYRWSTGRLLFNDNSDLEPYLKRIGDMSAREIARRFFTRMTIPASWKMLPDGIIWPGCYVRSDIAHSQFQSVGDYQFYLNDSRIDKITNEEMMKGGLSIPDGEVLSRANTLAAELMGKEKLSECTAAERIAIARILKKEKGCNHKQLARITRLALEDISKLV